MPTAAITTNDLGRRTEPYRLDRIAVANGLFMVGSIGLFMGYLCLCTYASENGYRLRDAERRVVTLTEQRERQSMAMLSSQALGNVDVQAKQLGLVPIEKIQYVNAVGSVAMR